MERVLVLDTLEIGVDQHEEARSFLGDAAGASGAVLVLERG